MAALCMGTTLGAGLTWPLLSLHRHPSLPFFDVVVVKLFAVVHVVAANRAQTVVVAAGVSEAVWCICLLSKQSDLRTQLWQCPASAPVPNWDG